MMTKSIAALVGLVLSLSYASATITIGSINDFQDGTPQDWSHGGPSQVPPINVADAGPTGTGDHALHIRTTGVGFGPGSRYIAFNTADAWLGDYGAAGVTGVRADVHNIGDNALDLRFAVNGPGGWFTTPAIQIAAGTAWQHHLFSLRPLDLDYIDGGTNDVDATLAAVNFVQIYSTITPVLGGGNIPIGDVLEGGSAHFDNFRTVPEPSGLLLASLALLWMGAKRTRRG